MSKEKQTNNPQYGNWVSNKLVKKTIIVLVFFIFAFVLLFILPIPSSGLLVAFKGICLFLVIILLITLAYFLKAKQVFSYTGGKLQDKVLDEIITKIQWDGEGKALDIGCGSGALTIKLAKKFKNARITGLDYWGSDWDYCKSQCETNTKIMRVNKNIEFLKASASNLPFENEVFDLVVSNMTFHEVNDCKNKLNPVREALRVLKKDSIFVFQDLFKLKPYFGTIDELLNNIKDMGIRDVKFADTSQLTFIPKMMKLPFMLGTVGIIYGIK